MSHAIRIHETGGPEVLRFESVDVPDPRPGEVTIGHTAIGVNFIDTYHRSGLYPLPSLPHGLGMEAVGVVEALGEGVDDLAEGDRVAYLAGPPGSYADRRVVPANRVVPLPDSIDDEAAASLLKGLTVEYLVRRTFRVEPGMTVVLHAAAGGVGQIAARWLRGLGATVIGTVGSARKVEIARKAGCHHVVVLPEESLPERVRALTDGQGVPVVYDSVGKDTLEASLDSLRPRGLLVSFGNASGPPPPLQLLDLARRGSLFVTRPSLFDYVATHEDLLDAAGELFAVLERGTVTLEVGHRWPLRDAAEAHRALEARETTGSVILLP